MTGFTRGLAVENWPSTGSARQPDRAGGSDTEQVPIGQFIKPENRAKADLTLPLNRFRASGTALGPQSFSPAICPGWVTGQSW